MESASLASLSSDLSPRPSDRNHRAPPHDDTAHLVSIGLLAYHTNKVAMSTDLATEVCPSSAAFFGFMGVASSMVFGSECKMVFSDENRRSFDQVPGGAFRWHRPRP